jgi:chromosome segregation protein
MLIEEAAGLGKHRKRRRRAQLKLDRTQDNLDRALDVEREARTRLRPLKRQAEAAELHERLARQTDEARWVLARDAARSARAALAMADAETARARAAAQQAEAELGEVAARRERAEAALAARGDERERLTARFHGARSASERIGMRLEAARQLEVGLADRTGRRERTVAALAAEAEADVGDEGAPARVAALEAELEQLAQDRAERLARELAELEERRAAAAAELARLAEDAERAAAARRAADAAVDDARRARRERDGAVEAARRAAARAGAELAGVNQFLRAHAGAPGGAPALADSLSAAPGYELALAAVLGPRLRAAVAGDLAEAARLLERTGRDGGAALVAPAESGGPSAMGGATPAGEAGGESSPPIAGGAVPAAPCAGATPLSDHVIAAGDGPGARLAQGLLAGVWVVDDIGALPPSFAGVAVTRDGRVWTAAARELRQVPAGGEDRVLAERNRREELVAAVERAARDEQAALTEAERASQALAAADALRDEADGTARAAARARDAAADAERHARHLIEQRRTAPDDGPVATRRAQLRDALATERRLAERAERERRERERRIAHERDRLAREQAVRPQAERLAAALESVLAAVRERLAALDAELAADRHVGERLAGELRACAATEQDVRGRLKALGEEVTRAEVAAQRSRDAHADAQAVLAELAERLGLEPEPATDPLPDEDRANLEARIERLGRRRAQLGPVNPLAQQEYAEAQAHVEDLEAQREDLEAALRELRGLIRETDHRIKTAFEETFEAAARNFEEVARQLFPGGRGRLRLVREDAGPRPVLGGGEPSDEAAPADAERIEEALDAAADDDHEGPDDGMGVEIEITPAGKATKRLSLLSGGEKSMTALAFLFAVFLARPCPFYILDEVEAALDDLNIDRFLTMLRGFADRAQFIVVTHQKRTMEAADCLYGVSMADDGVSRVVSRRLPREDAAGRAA